MSKRSRRKGPTSRDTRRDAIKAKRRPSQQEIAERIAREHGETLRRLGTE